MPVTDQHKDYKQYLPQWQTVRDCVKGKSAIEKKKTKYLPKPSPDDLSPENEKRYDDYLQRANFVGFTGSTLSGMLGMVFKKQTVHEVDSSIEYIKKNANGGGLTLDQMARKIISDVIQTGRFGLLVDYPKAPKGLTKAQVSAMNLQASILTYATERIINWRTHMVGGVRKLSLVVLMEDHEEIAADGFGTECKEYHRVLKIEGGKYIQVLYDDKENIVDIVEPTDSTGKRWNEIPFVFVGSENNDEVVDKSPLYDLAEINISHYRNSADFEESAFMVGQPTPVISGLSQAWVDEVLKGGVSLGSRTAVLLPENASADLLQAQSNTMPAEGMKEKEAQMVKIGARIIQDAGGNETAEAAKMRFGGQNSQLGTIVGNAQSALLDCFEWAKRFMGGVGDSILEINREFYDKRVDPQLIVAAIQMVDRGIITKNDLRDDLRSSGMIDEARTNEQIDEEAEIGITF